MSVKVRVENLPYYTTESQLADLLAEAGQVVDVYLPADRAYAIVEFADATAAARCIERFNGEEVGGRRLSILAADAPRH